jgi:hypothetical protein
MRYELWEGDEYLGIFSVLEAQILCEANRAIRAVRLDT